MFNSIVDDYNSGLNQYQLASKYSRSRNTIKRILDANGIILRKPNESYNLRKSKTELNHTQIQLILGSLLGDTCLYKQYFLSRQTKKMCYTYRLAFAHSEKQYDYLKYKHLIMGRNNKIQTRLSGYNANIKYFTFTDRNILESIAQYTLKNDKKAITEEWLNKLDPMGIAFWYMDDGTFSGKNGSVMFCTNSFNCDELNILQHKLKSYDINTTLNKSNNKSINYPNQFLIRVKSCDRVKLFDLINPWIHKSMDYKLHQYAQQFSGTLGTKVFC